jgi:hypothetical protein
MANNKTGVHSGISPTDREALRRLENAHRPGRIGPGDRAIEVPKAMTKPGRPYDRSRHADEKNRKVDLEITEKGELGNTYESNDLDTGHVSHNNR